MRRMSHYRCICTRNRSGNRSRIRDVVQERVLLVKETEGIIFAAKEMVLGTHSIKYAIDRSRCLKKLCTFTLEICFQISILEQSGF